MYKLIDWLAKSNPPYEVCYQTKGTSIADPDPVGSGPYWSDPEQVPEV
jgi:hypothetical protein